MSIDILESSVLLEYNTVNENEIDKLLENELNTFKQKIIVLDDDPTGIQTVQNVYVYTEYDEETIREIFKSSDNLSYILTNSRSFSEQKTIEVHKNIGKIIGEISKEYNIPFFLIVRGDSTLRAHYPIENDTLKDAIYETAKISYDGDVFVPFFKEGNRYTLNNIHYIKVENNLVPCGQSEFAKDKTFGYKSSNLLDYIEEKSDGAYKKENLIYISLDEIRNLDFDAITKKLLSAKDFNKIVVNAIDYADIKIFTIALIRAIKSGKNFLARSSACFPKIIGNNPFAPLLTKNDIVDCNDENGGLIIVGSHVKKTTEQLSNLMKIQENICFLEFDVNEYFNENGLFKVTNKILEQCNDNILNGITTVIYTSRKVISKDHASKDELLNISVKISEEITKIVKNLSVKPKFIIAKGGITSSDVGTKGLMVKKALVLGQIKPGIPVWKTGEESTFKNMPYVIFPGNVGDSNTLKEIAQLLME